MRLLVFFVTIITLTLTFSACHYSNLSDQQSDCGDDETINYTTDIRMILEYYECLKCHNEERADADITLHNYESVQLMAVGWDNLLPVIDHEAGYEPMPPRAPKMDSCSIAIVKEWIRKGAPEN